MYATSSGVLIGLVAVAIVACGGDSKKNHAGVDSGGASTGEAGAGSGDGDGGSDLGGGPGTQSSTGGSTSAGGVPAAGGMSGGSSGTPSTSGTSVSGASGAPDGIGGDASEGGSSSGGASTTDTPAVSGTGGEDLIEPPLGCESVRQSEDAESCSYEYKCDGRTHFDSCTLEIDGSFTCECGTFSSSTRYFEIGGVETMEACSVIARVCESEVPTSPTQVCRLKESVVEGDTCTSYASCGYELDLGPGIVARTIERRRAQCKPVYPLVADVELDCSCVSDSAGSEGYRVIAPSAGAACEPMLGVCLAQQSPVYAGRACALTDPSGIVEQTCPNDPACQGCAMSWTCWATAEIADNVSIIDTNTGESRAIACRPEEGELHCACYDQYLEGVYGDETVPASVLDVCRETTVTCPEP